ncbi:MULTISPECIES: 50S ribosomal protein L29 [Methanosarcina]|jgi:large subunit ribosomal protein L29|uniref:Large ribosomal subunit protein uL29 n=8 Tax=Methanosarcina mazei TaxID=2209 RepID=RL29_METMA|nr:MULTISPECIES: 50S ribosomal protein L29 [Methanosarcina]Q8PV43.1 RecName: Full=Large ribosomal subunit protein uL29; AltName: Full=50S ribosomal protein L29 [Methanosarcina mazei Go1]AAM31827.1 LSU ribosomal protein L29P [Methanosarcina mazei Go1]AGF97510.1 LSU ribosomal protein L35e (L29p) [Methanosarcina mazei Tuc01]AKB41502.1 LSU ribosomal protein L35e (L29p) [Methanosarcina mazei WWM610]AKB62415.1 LSU ribosomal protein L35e (L29p) [Methanosarcina mazei SarPi]AKB65749.1 LSU ribosomal pr
MAILRTSEIRTMTIEERADELENLKNELVRERALTSAGGAPDNPGRIGEIRRTIARIKTIQHELNEI